MFWRFSYPSQLRAVFEWLSAVVHGTDVVLVRKEGRDDFFRFAFPLRQRDMPKRGKADRDEASFIIDFCSSSRFVPGPEWTRIFSSPEVAVFEKKDRISGGVPLPLRYGLEEGERKAALRLARDTIAKFFATGQKPLSYPRGFPARFSFRADVDVALWVRGALRGSMVVENQSLVEGIAEASYRAARDPRFKPLSHEELPALRIQMTLLHDLRVPLSAAERAANRIYAEKGYCLKHEGKTGWYLPEVLNVRRFRNLEEFLNDLAEEKAKIRSRSSRAAETLVFEVEDFIESVSGNAPITLYGPVPRPYAQPEGEDEVLSACANRAAAWLCALQEEDGNIPPIVDPLRGRALQIDWIRLAFTALALAEFASAVKDERARSAAERSFRYLMRHLSGRELPSPHYELALAYAGQLALALHEFEEAERIGRLLAARAEGLKFEPVLFSQVATFFALMAKRRSRAGGHANAAVRFLEAARKEFEKQRGASPSFAAWAESVHSALLLFELTGDATFRIFADRLMDWLTRRQLPNGAFPNSPRSDFVYSRGTGKIFEVLALRPEANKESLRAALRWLRSMQYSEDNAFFVPEEFRPRVLGGFRHDYLNHEAWIDAAGHVLLGSARILGSKNHPIS